MERVRASQPALDGIIPYDPKYLPARIYLSANENPDNLPQVVLDDVIEGLRALSCNRYPDPLANELRDMIAQMWGLERANVLLGNAGDELLFDVALAWGGEGRRLLTCPPTFSVYEANARLTNTTVVSIPRKADFSLDEEAILSRVAQGDIDLVIITSPNNPTGDIASVEFLEQLLAATDALVMVDEAYGEFGGTNMVPAIARHKNLIILRTFSKAYSAAGVRLGYVLAQPCVITELLKVRQPYSVDSISQLVGRMIIAHQDAFTPRIEAIKQERARLYQELSQREAVTVYPSHANYLLLQVDDAHMVWELLYEQGILVRDFSQAPGLRNCLRVSIGSVQENNAFLSALDAILQDRK